MWQICVFETTADGRIVPVPAAATPQEDAARRAYRTLGRVLDAAGLDSCIALYAFDSREPTGWREVLSTRPTLERAAA